MSRTSSGNDVFGCQPSACARLATHRRTARRPRSAGGSARRTRRSPASRARRGRRPARRTRGPCASRRSRRRSRRARPAGASATSPRRTRARSPSRGARRGCRGRASARCPPTIAATPRVTLRVTNVGAAPRRLVVEQDAVDREQVVRLAVLDRHPVGEDLGDGVRAARVERRRSRAADAPGRARTSRSSRPGRSGSAGRRGGSPRAGGACPCRSCLP